MMETRRKFINFIPAVKPFRQSLVAYTFDRIKDVSQQQEVVRVTSTEEICEHFKDSMFHDVGHRISRALLHHRREDL